MKRRKLRLGGDGMSLCHRGFTSHTPVVAVMLGIGIPNNKRTWTEVERVMLATVGENSRNVKWS